MSDIIQDEKSMINLLSLLKAHAIPFFVCKKLKSGEYQKFIKKFPMDIAGNSYKTAEDFLTHWLGKGFKYKGSLDSEDETKIKDLMIKLSYVINFGGGLELDTGDLELIEEIRLFSEGED